MRRVALTLVLSATIVALPTTRANAVVGGTSAVGNTAVVRLRTGTTVCSGALWTSRIVVTAAHCVVDASGTVTSNPVTRTGVGMNLLNNALGVHERALNVKSRRLEVLAQNIANADTPADKLLGTDAIGEEILNRL